MKNITFLTCLLAFFLGISSTQAQSPSSGRTSLTLKNDGRVMEDIGRIQAITFDPDGSLYALEPAGRRLIKINDDGIQLSQTASFGRPTDIVMAGFQIWVTDPMRGQISRFDRRLANLADLRELVSQESRIRLSGVVSAAITSGDVIVMLDSYEQRLYMVNVKGWVIDTIEGFGDLRTPMTTPVRVEVSKSGKIAVADESNGYVYIFDRFGSFLYLINTAQKNSGFNIVGLAWEEDTLWIGNSNGLEVYSEYGSMITSWNHSYFGGPIIDLAIDMDRLAVASDGFIAFYRIVRE